MKGISKNYVEVNLIDRPMHIGRLICEMNINAGYTMDFFSKLSEAQIVAMHRRLLSQSVSNAISDNEKAVLNKDVVVLTTEPIKGMYKMINTSATRIDIEYKTSDRKVMTAIISTYYLDGKRVDEGFVVITWSTGKSELYSKKALIANIHGTSSKPMVALLQRIEMLKY